MPTKSVLKNPSPVPPSGNEGDGKAIPKKSIREQTYSILGEDELTDGFNAHLVVPDVLEKSPPEQLPVIYGDGNSIEMGNLLTPEDLRYKPMINLEKTDRTKFYTLIMTDPDVPNRAMPTEREHLHWLVINITDQNTDKGEEIVPYKSPLPNLGSGLHRYVFVLLEQTRPITIATETEKTALLGKALESKSKKTPTKQSSKESKDPKATASSAGPGDKAKSDANHCKTKDEKSESCTLETVPLIECVNFSTKEFIKKYAIFGVLAANFFQTEYNEYVGKQLEAEKKGLLAEEKIEKIKKVTKIDEKKTMENFKNLKIAK